MIECYITEAYPDFFLPQPLSIDSVNTLGRCLARRRRRVLFRVTTEVKVSAGGRLEITTDVEPARRALHNCLSLARVGMVLKLPPGFGHVEWFGKGPFECYQDRKVSAALVLF